MLLSSIPQGVIDELHEYRLPSFIQPCTLSEVGAAYVRGALSRLHQGELEAIILSQELDTDFKVIGTIGILLLLEKRGLLNANQTWQKITQLTERHNMYLSPQLLKRLKMQLLDFY